MEETREKYDYKKAKERKKKLEGFRIDPRYEY